MTKTRLEAFSDGVLAIIITIMVLELHAPHGADWEDLHPLVFSFLSYVMSFIYIGIYWGNHHHLIHTVQQVNSKIIWANLHLLFWLSIIPFSTAWMGENSFEKLPTCLYAFNLLICAIAYFILQNVIHSEKHITGALADAMKKQERKGQLSLILYLVALGAAWVLPSVSLFLIVLVAILWLIPDRNIEKALSE